MPEIKDRFGNILDVETYFERLWVLITPFNEEKYDAFFVQKSHVRSLSEWAEIRQLSRALPSHTRKTASLWDDYLFFIKTIWPVQGMFCDEFAIALGGLLAEFKPQKICDFHKGPLQRFKQYILSLPRADLERTLAEPCEVERVDSPLVLTALLDCWSDNTPTPETFEKLIVWLAGKAPRLLPKGPTFDALYQKHKIGPYISNIILEAYLNDLPCNAQSPEAALKRTLLDDLTNGLALLSPQGLKALRNLYACRSEQVKDTDNDYFASSTKENQRWFYFLELISHCVDLENPYQWLVPSIEHDEIADEGLYWEFPPTQFIVAGDGKRLLYLPYLAKVILGAASENGEIPAAALHCYDGEAYRTFEHKEVERLRRSAYWRNQGLIDCLDNCFGEKVVLTLSHKSVEQIRMLLEGIFFSIGLFVEKSYTPEQNEIAIKAFTNFILYLETLKSDTQGNGQDEFQRLMKYPVTIHNREETFSRWLARVQDPARQDNCIAVFSNVLLEIVLDYYPHTKFSSPEISAFKHLESQRNRSACYAIRDFVDAPAANYEHRIIRLAVSLFTGTFNTYYGLGKTTISLDSITNEVTESGVQLWKFLENYLEPGYSKRPHILAFIWANCVDLIKGALANPSFGRVVATTSWLESLLKIDTAEMHKTVQIYEGVQLLAAMLDNAMLLKQKSHLYGFLCNLLKDAQKTLDKPEDTLSFKQHLQVHVLWYKLVGAIELQTRQKLNTTLKHYIAYPNEARSKIQNTKMRDMTAKVDDDNSMTGRVFSTAKKMFLWTKNTPSSPAPNNIGQVGSQPT